MPRNLSSQGFGGVSKHGKIKSVYCKNFVTYSECVFYPTEYLNVIIGPNGTGKSTLVSAIVLGLGGDPKILARSSSIGEYVKNGCESAEVVVEIHGEDDETTKFQRNFALDGKSQFAIDGNRVVQKKFLEHVDVFKIQIGNLCQFLPQDRVQDFAKMNPQEILANTINSICDADTVDNFRKLKELRNQQENGKSNYNNMLQKLEESMHRVSQLQTELERFNKRKDVEEQLDVCNAKKLRLEVEEIQSKITELKSDFELAKGNLVTYEREYEVVIKKQSKIDSITNKLKKEVEERDRSMKVADDKKNQIIQKIEHLKNKINEEKSKFEKKKREANERQNELKHELKMLEVYAQDLKNLSSDEMSESEQQRRISDCDSKIEKIKQERQQLNQEHRNTLNQIDEDMPEIQSLKSRLQSLENVNESKLEFLKLKHPDVYRAVVWLHENKEMFKGRVYKPVILEINVTNSNYSKYLENTINIRDLLAFSCEETSDLSLLVTELCTKQKLMINVFHAPTPDERIFIPRIPIENIQKYGFESYLIDLVNGPTALLGYLCSLYHLQNIPFGDNRVNRCTDKIPHDIRNYFGGDLRYILSHSKYGNKASSLTQTAISSRGLLWSRDENDIQEKKNRLSELIRVSDSLKNQRTAIEVQIREKEHRYREVSQIKKEIQSKKFELQQKVSMLERQKQKVARLQEEVVSFPEMERDLKEFGAKAVRDIILLQKVKVDALSAFQKAMADKLYAKTKMSIFKQENEELVNRISNAKEKRDSAKARVDIISDKTSKVKRDCKLKLAESLKLTNNVEPTDKKFLHHTFYISLPTVMEELRDKISDLCGRLECMEDVNSEIVREYEAKRSYVETLKQDIECNLHGNENFVAKIKTIYDIWYPTISNVVMIINKHFGDFMQSMDYVGEVKLVHKDEYDFDSYGIEILVQYRKNVPLQALNRHVQSGGERAVAIAVYTLSMQHLTHVPFRCVDEINQGMDARNERKIFEMLVNETTKVGSSQYFFVTPKLLRNLKANNRMSVHIVFNGRMVQSQKAFAII